MINDDTRLWLASLLEMCVPQTKVSTNMKISAETFNFDISKPPSRGSIQRVLEEIGIIVSPAPRLAPPCPARRLSHFFCY